MQLLRALTRGKPVQASPLAPSTPTNRGGHGHTVLPAVIYSTQSTQWPVPLDRIDGNLVTELNKRAPRLIHGSAEYGVLSTSDPVNGKIHPWSWDSSIGALQFTHFAYRYPGDAMYGRGQGMIVGVPNLMELSEIYGMVYAEGCPNGRLFFKPADEQFGRLLFSSNGLQLPDHGIPKIPVYRDTPCAIWIAKSSCIPTISSDMCGIFAGSSLGILSAYSLGSARVVSKNFAQGELTARWVICPGVPIIQIAIDEHYDMVKARQGRIWAIVLNALGEIYYLTRLPSMRHVLPDTELLADDWIEYKAWTVGRSVEWQRIESTRRTARPDPYSDASFDGSYSPCGSWDGMRLGKNQLIAETAEIEEFLANTPAKFQSLCCGWDMQRRLEVDFGAVSTENIAVISTGEAEETVPLIFRYSRSMPVQGKFAVDEEHNAFSPGVSTEVLCLSYNDWHTSQFIQSDARPTYISTTVLDKSLYSIKDNDLSENMGIFASPSTPLHSGKDSKVNWSSCKVPGDQARFLAVGTSSGTVYLYNIRAPPSLNNNTINEIVPLKTIQSDSPSITSLALSSLCVVVGGSDGLVQAWDVLGSSLSPIRTLHSRFSTRARRRIAQAATSPQGTGIINMWAAGALYIDPDPTILRGAVALGSHILYWHFSSSAADAYRSQKRRSRKSERNVQSGGERYVTSPRSGAVYRFIENEILDHEREEEQQRRKSERLAGRYGTELLGEDATDEEIMAYATLLSEESASQDVQRKPSTDNQSRQSLLSPISNNDMNISANIEEIDDDVAEAIRLSLELSKAVEATNYLHVYDGVTPLASSSSAQTSVFTADKDNEDDDIEFALQLSMAEEQNRRDAEVLSNENADWYKAEHVPTIDEFPALSSNKSQKEKGKDRAK